MDKKAFWCFMACFTLLILGLSSWPAIKALLDAQTNFPKLWIYATYGTSNLFIPVWIVTFFYFNFGEHQAMIMKVLAGLYAVVVTCCSGYSSTSLLNALMMFQGSGYSAVSLYLIILNALQLYIALALIFVTIWILLDPYTGNEASTKTGVIYVCSMFLTVIACAFFIIRAAILECPITLELLVMLLGLIFFGIIFLIFLLPFIKYYYSSSKFGVITSILYFLLYFPFFSYWTIRSLIAFHQNINSFGEAGTWMLSFSYFISIGSLIPGMIGLIILGLLLGSGILYVVIYGIIVLCAAIFKKCCPQAFTNDDYIQVDAMLLNDSLVNPQPYLLYQAQPTINLQEEKFNPGKHRQSFLEEEVCSVCLEGFEAEQIVTYWPKCEHLFHKECLSYWIKKNPTCPNCKQPYNSNTQQVGEAENLPPNLEFEGFSF